MAAAPGRGPAYGDPMRHPLVPIAIAVAVVAPPLTVAAAGTCPAGPPDVSPYPCMPWEFLVRALFSPFALPFHVLLWGGWLALCASGAIWFGVARAVVIRLAGE
jgi:hypothetical protein